MCPIQLPASLCIADQSPDLDLGRPASTQFAVDGESEQTLTEQIERIVAPQLADGEQHGDRPHDDRRQEYLTDLAYYGYWSEPRNVMLSLRATW